MSGFHRTLLCGASVLTALALSGAAQAGQSRIVTYLPPPESVCKDCATPNGRPKPAPPAGFNAFAASNEELQHYGFPPRPDRAKDPAAYAFWSSLVTLPVKRIVPKQQATTVYNSPAIVNEVNQQRPHNLTIPTGTAISNWSGYADVAPIGHYPFRPDNTYVYGSFVVPVAQQAYGTCNATNDYASFKVGIDGWNNSEMLETGVEADASCSGGTTTAYYSGWYEWYPAPEIRISSPAVAPGDRIVAYVWNTTRTLGNYYMANLSQNTATSVEFSAPNGTQLDGNSVEWIVERPFVGRRLTTLTNYVASPWFYAFALTAAGHYYAAGLPTGTTSYSLTMTDDSNNDISYCGATPENKMIYVSPTQDIKSWHGSDLWCFDEGSAL
jgi:hypothetical protein